MRAHAHVGHEWLEPISRAHLLEQIAKALRPRDGRGGGRGGELLRVDPLGELGEHRGDLTESARVEVVADKIRPRFR